LETIVPENKMPLGTVLVADGNADFRDPLEHMLRAHGYRVFAAADGAQALALLEKHAVDLALLDVRMPRENGFRVCRAVKTCFQTRLTPVVLFIGIGRGEDRIRGIVAGADDFLSKPLRKEELLARVRSLVRLKQYADELESSEAVLCALADSIERQDPHTKGHCFRLSRYAVALAVRLGLPEEQRVALRRGGIVHDIGKVSVPPQVLLKPGPLDPEERRRMETHTIVGEQICAPLKFLGNVLPIIRWHHERQDGSGYPDHLKGEKIPLPVRILQTVDIYDALTTDRPYRRALTREQAFHTLREEVRCGWRDGTLVDALEGLLRSSPELPAPPQRVAMPVRCANTA
jgi:putative two-component system response regulator